MTRSIAVLICCAMIWIGCTPTSSHRPSGRDGGTVAPGEDGGTFVRDDTGTFVLRDVGPLPDVGPADSDNDGIPDGDEARYGTDPNNADSDNDGVNDGVEVLAGTDPTSAASTIPATDFYVVLPYNDPEVHRALNFTARLGRADIYFLVDTTGSMTAALNNVRTSLATQIVPAINDAIADAVMGVGDFRDYYDSSPGADPMMFGGPGDYVYMNRQSMTADTAAVQSALNALRIGGGNDGPESSTEALYLAAAGTCSGGSGFGQACFRSMSHPIIVHVTDAPFHNGPGNSNPYLPAFNLHTFSQMTAALNAQNVKIVGAAIGTMIFGIASYSSEDDLNATAMATMSRAADGSTTVYRAAGGRVSDQVVAGISDLVGASTQDVSARKLDDTTDTVDATMFITAITPTLSSRPVNHMDATTFYGVPGGATITFDVTFVNTTTPATSRVQLYRAFIEVFDVASGTALDRRNVYIVIPAMGGSILI